MGVMVILLIIGLVIGLRLIAGTFDGDRVETYLRENGSELVDRSWDPFGPGWYGEKDARIYQIVYRDRQKNLHKAHVKTSMLSGVYLTNDHIIQLAPSDPQIEDEDPLAAENRRLRQRIKDLESGKS